MEKSLFTSGRTSGNSMRQEDTDDSMPDDDTCISVPSIKELGLQNNAEVSEKSKDPSTGNSVNDVITSDMIKNGEIKRVLVLNDTSKETSETLGQSNKPSVKRAIDDVKAGERYNDKSHSVSGTVEIKPKNPSKVEDSHIKSRTHVNTVSDKINKIELKENHASSEENHESSKKSGDTHMYSMRSYVSGVTISDQMNFHSASEKDFERDQMIEGRVSTVSKVESPHDSSLVNEDISTHTSDDEKNKHVINSSRANAREKEISKEIDTGESSDSADSDALSGKGSLDHNKTDNDNQNESGSESECDDESSNSDVNNCFGDDEIASRSSVEHWTELEVEKDMIDKLVIHKADGEPVVNLAIIRQIRRGEFRTDSELSDKTERAGSISESTHRKGSKPGITLRKGSKSFKKTAFPTSHVTTTNESNDKDHLICESNKLMNESLSGLNNEVKPTSCDNHASINEIDTSSSESDTNGSVSESSDESDSETTSLKSSQTGNSSVKDIKEIDGGYSDKKHTSSSSIKINHDQHQSDTCNTSTQKIKTSENGFNSGVKSLKAKTESKYANHSNRLIKSNRREVYPDTKKVLSVENKEKIHSTKISSNNEKRLDQIAKLKQIYRQKTNIKDSDKRSHPSTLPNTATPKRSPSYSMKQVTLHYDRNIGEDKRSTTKPFKVNEKTSVKNAAQRSSINPTNSRTKNDTTRNTILTKRREPTGIICQDRSSIHVEYIDLNSNTQAHSKTAEDYYHAEKQQPGNTTTDPSSVVHTKCQRALHLSKSLEDKSINRFHKEISDICNKDATGGSNQTTPLQPKQKVDRRFEITISEMFALHGGSSVDTNDSDFAMETNAKASKVEETNPIIETELPAHITQALIADMPIQKLSAEDIARPSSTQISYKRNKHSTSLSEDVNSTTNNCSRTNGTTGNTPEHNQDSPKHLELETSQPHSKNNGNNAPEEKDSHTNGSLNMELQEKRKRLQASKTYDNIREYKLPESHVISSPKGLETPANDLMDKSGKPKALSKVGDPISIEDKSTIQDDSPRSIVVGILDAFLYQLFASLENRFNGPTKRCTSLDDEGNDILCCILQAPENKVDPSTFTCEVVDPLEVPPITRRHEFLISHVIKICTYNVGHIACEREMVAKIPIAHYFVEPWQEVVIREVDKSGHWVDTGEDVDIVQIPDMGNVVYGVQIFLKELTYVAVVTRPRITTLTLEHRDKIITSPSDDRVKLRVPGTSDPRTVSLQSIPITEKIIKDFENTRGPEVTSYLTATSPLVILSLEGPNPESFSFAVPFTHVNYLDDTNTDPKQADSLGDHNGQKESSDKDNEEADEIPNVPPRVRERMDSALLHQEISVEENKVQNRSAKSQLQELEIKVHKREKERYLVLLSDGHDRSVQIKLLDDTDRLKRLDIETFAQEEEFVKFSVYDTYARLFAIEVHDIVNFQEIQSTVKGLANYLLKHRVRVNVYQDKNNLYTVKFTATVDQPYRQKWPRERQHRHVEENSDGVRYLEMNEGDAIGLTFRGNIEVTNHIQRVFSFHGYCGIYASFDLKIKDPFSQKSLPEFHGAVQVYTLKRPRMKSISTTRVQNVSTDWDLFSEYHFLLPKHLKKTPIIVNRAPISLRFQEPLTVEFVRLMCRELVKDWDTFAFSLGISTARIQAIKQHNRNQISERVLMDVIVCWMKHQPMSRDKVGPILSALRMCRKPNLENELTQRHKALKDCRAKTARDKHIQRAALALSSSRAVSVRWRQLVGYLLHLELNDVRICDITSEIEEKYKNDATKCYHALQYWNSISGSPTIWKIVDALRHCNCHVAANTLRVQEQKRR